MTDAGAEYKQHRDNDDSVDLTRFFVRVGKVGMTTQEHNFLLF